jgi:hypothetical protein
VQAHRFAYELAYGAIPPGLWALHHCDNPPCVRPDHLFLGTQSDNMLDAIHKGRRPAVPPGPPGGPLRGEHIRSSRLTAPGVRAIRERYAVGGVTQDALAAEYGVTQATISHIVLRKSWRHIP